MKAEIFTSELDEKRRTEQVEHPKLKVGGFWFKSLNAQSRREKIVRAFNNEPGGRLYNYFCSAADTLLNFSLAGCNKPLKDTRLCEDVEVKLCVVSEICPVESLLKTLNKKGGLGRLREAPRGAGGSFRQNRKCLCM